MIKKCTLLLMLLLLTAGLFSTVHALTLDLNQSNVDLGISGDFLTVNVDVTDGLATFIVDANEDLLNPNDEVNFGIDNFLFNVRPDISIAEDQFTFFDANGDETDRWGVTIDPNRTVSLFGNFDFWTAGSGQDRRQDPLVFEISGLTGYTDDIFNIQNSDGFTMAAHVGALGPFNGQSSAWFSDGGSPPAPVPEPATMLLLGTGLVGMAGLGRKRFKK